MRSPYIQTVSFALVALLHGTSSSLGVTPILAVEVNSPRYDTVLHSRSGQTQSTTLRQLSAKQDLLDATKRLPPRLPPGAAAKKLGGHVVLRADVGPSGMVQEASIIQSSGSKLLDETARTWVQYVWRYSSVGGKQSHREQIDFRSTNEDVKSETALANAGRADHPDTPSPPFPHLAILQEWQGSVRLKLIPDGRARVKEAEILRSSGVPFLDQIAKAWCESYWRLPKNTEAIGLVTFRLP